MLTKNLLKRTSVVVGLTTLSFFLGFMSNLMLENISLNDLPLLTATTLFYDQGKVNRLTRSDSVLDQPVRLSIPKINVDAMVEQVGFTSEWAMAVPKDHTNAAWFDLGPLPGERGSAVIAGHYGWRDGLPAVFDGLYKLQAGDKLYVEDEKGLINTFVVRTLRTYGESEAVPDVFSSSDGKAHLNLITCGGVWNQITKSYPSRLVVFTDKEI